MKSVENEEVPVGAMKMKEPLLWKKRRRCAYDGARRRWLGRTEMTFFLFSERTEMRKKEKKKDTLVNFCGCAQPKRVVYIFPLVELSMWVGERMPLHCYCDQTTERRGKGRKMKRKGRRRGREKGKQNREKGKRRQRTDCAMPLLAPHCAS